MKVVVNKCYGGFGLSSEAQVEYCKLIGKEVFFYKEVQRELHGYKYIRVSAEDGDSLFSYALFKDLGETTDGLPEEHELWASYGDIPRNDSNLIQVVEKLGDRANTRYSQLEIVEIPDGTDYQIEEYDGMEWVAEKHRTW